MAKYDRIGLGGAPGFSEEAYYGPVAPMREILQGAPVSVPQEIGPRLLSKLLDSLDPGDQMPGPIFAGRSSPVHIDADPVDEASIDQVRQRVQAGRPARQDHHGLSITLFQGRTGGLMLECPGDAPAEPVARAAIDWSVAANHGNLCLWGGRMSTGDWLLGLTP